MKTLYDRNKEHGKNYFKMAFGDCFDLSKVIAHPIIKLNHINREETKKLKSKELIVINYIRKVHSTDSASQFEASNSNPPKGLNNLFIKFWIAKSKYTYDEEKELLTIPIWIFNNLQVAPVHKKFITPEMAWNYIQDEYAIGGGHQGEGFADLSGGEASTAYWNCD